MDLSSGSAKGEFNYLPYLTIRMPSFFSRHENGCDKTTSLSLLLFTFCHLNQLRYNRARATSNLPTYLPPAIASKKLPPKSSILLAPLLSSPRLFLLHNNPFFLLYPQKKNSRQVRCTSAPSFLSGRLDRTGLNWTRPKDCGGCSLQCN